METEGKQNQVKTEEEAKVIFYMTLVEKLNQKADILPRPDGSNKVDLNNYSKAYQNFAQNNVSKSEKIETSIEVKDQYKKKLEVLLASKKSN